MAMGGKCFAFSLSSFKLRLLIELNQSHMARVNLVAIAFKVVGGLFVRDSVAKCYVRNVLKWSTRT